MNLLSCSRMWVVMLLPRVHGSLISELCRIKHHWSKFERSLESSIDSARDGNGGAGSASGECQSLDCAAHEEPGDLRPSLSSNLPARSTNYVRRRVDTNHPRFIWLFVFPRNSDAGIARIPVSEAGSSSLTLCGRSATMHVLTPLNLRRSEHAFVHSTEEK